MKLYFLYLYLFLSGAVFGQKIEQFSGMVLDRSTNTPLQGVTLTSLVGEQTTSTDERGVFALTDITLPYSVRLSYVGFKDTIFRIEKGMMGSVLKIYLSPLDNRMDEVIVSTGFQKIPKDRATGSFDLIDNKLFNRQVSTDVISRLEGIASSLLFDHRENVGDGASFSIRGLSTIYSNTKPLIVLNDFPYEGDIGDINPNDVENITVLKDATAASIWGVRAGNGVIVITTKKSKASQAPRVMLTSNMSHISKPDLMRLPYMSSSDYIDVERMLFDNQFYDAIEQLEYRPLSPAVELMYQQQRGIITSADLEGNLNVLRRMDIRKDMEKYLYRSGFNQQYALSILGNAERLNYAVSGGYDNNVGVLDQKYRRYTLRTENNITLSDRLKAEFSLLFSHTDTKSGNSAYNQFSTLFPYTSLADREGNKLPVDRYYRSSFLEQQNGKGLLDWTYRPLDELRSPQNNQVENNVLINTGLSYDIGYGINTVLKYQFDYGQQQGHRQWPKDSYYVRDLVNLYSQVDDQGNVVARPIPYGDILGTSTGLRMAHSLRLQTNYSKSWDRHEIIGLMGGELRQVKFTTMYTQQYGFDPDILTNAAVNYDTDYLLYGPNGGYRAKIAYSDYNTETLNRFVSVFTNWAYTYDKRYNLTVSARKDGSNLFGVKSNQKLTPLWSVGASWVASNEPFFKKTWFELLKLRSTFGYSGNLNANVSALPIIMFNNGGNLTNSPYAVLRNPPNEHLRWERNGQWNLGLDFSLKGSRLNGSLEYFFKKNTDLIGYMPLDQTTGAISPATLTFSYLGNSADMESRGVDIQLHSKNIEGTLNWQTDLLYSFIDTEVTKYLAEVRGIDQYINGGNVVSPIVGRPLYAISALKWAGLDPENGDPVGYLHGVKSKDYAAIRSLTTPEELVYFGSATPTHFGALRNTFAWKQLSLSFNLSYRLGFYFRRSSVSYGAIFNGTGFHADFDRRWQKPGDETITDVPSMQYPIDANRDSYFYPRSEILIARGDNIRLQDINLSYAFTTLKEKWKLRRLDLFVYVNNVALIWKADKHDVDPEYGVLPPARTSSVGLKIEF